MSLRSFSGRGHHGKRGRDRSDAVGGGASDDRDDASASGPLRQREAYMRMNFLFQAAHLTATGPAACLPLSRFYTATLRKIGSRLTIRSSAPVKSDTCKVCYSLLTPHPTTAAVVGGDREVTVTAAGAVLDLSQMGSTVSLHASSPTAAPALIRTCRCCRTQRRVGLKRRTKRQAAAAAATVAATAREESQPMQQSHVHDTTTASGATQPVEQILTAARMSTDVDGMR